MKYSIALAALATAVAASDHPLLVRQNSNPAEEYIQEVCFPNTTSPVPPCQAIINIESACLPNGTTPSAYQAHQQCMCNGGYFPNWSGCLNCQYVHGTRSEAVYKANENIISSASSSFCGAATPTAVFASYFAEVSNAAPQTASGFATTLSDQYPSQSAVSLYYTATGNQGPGAITGSAAQATATASSSAAASGSSSASLAAGAATTSKGLTTASSSASKMSSTSSHSSSGSATGSSSAASSSAAAHTGAANAVTVSEGLLAVVAGAMMLM